MWAVGAAWHARGVSEADEQTEPRTRESLAVDLRRLGVRPGSVVLVHSSLSSLGWVCGGPVVVVQALLDVLGPEGTLVVPTHTGVNSDPAGWVNPPVPESWWPVIRAHMPPFDPALTPSTAVGIVPETVRNWPGAVRSDHPRTSFAALGARAKEVTADHRLDSGLGEESPLGRVYALDGDILLLGVGHGNNTSIHLAEYRTPDSPVAEHAAAVRTADGEREWATWTEVDVDSDDFERLGADFDAAHPPSIGLVGSARCTLARQREVVDFAVGWLKENRRRT
jgi:aminoglycoside 3-N-acetyltransferase